MEAGPSLSRSNDDREETHRRPCRLKILPGDTALAVQRVEDDHLVLRGAHGSSTQPLSAGLSAGSHHPDWFTGVIDSFRRELEEPARRGANQREAECCLMMLSLAYASGAQGARFLEMPESSQWLAGAAAAA